MQRWLAQIETPQNCQPTAAASRNQVAELSQLGDGIMWWIVPWVYWGNSVHLGCCFHPLSFSAIQTESHAHASFICNFSIPGTKPVFMRVHISAIADPPTGITTMSCKGSLYLYKTQSNAPSLDFSRLVHFQSFLEGKLNDLVWVNQVCCCASVWHPCCQTWWRQWVGSAGGLAPEGHT